METIKYQGQGIEVRQIAEINVTRRRGMDSILRDEAGRYYFRRELHDDDDVAFHVAKQSGEHGYRCFLHRINLNAAILWSIDCCGDHGWLRGDAANVLMEGRGIDDPPPFPYMSREEWLASDEYKALAAADPLAKVPEGGCLVSVRPTDGGEPFEVTLDAAEREKLEEKARAEGTSFEAAFLALMRRQLGVSLPVPESGQQLDLSFELEPFHADLLKTFVRRHQIDVTTLTREVLVWHLGEMFDYSFNGGSCEQGTAEIDGYGSYSEELTPERLRMLCRSAGLKPEKYVNAVGEYDPGIGRNLPSLPPVTLDRSRVHQSNGTPLHGLNAAAPEPVEDWEVAAAQEARQGDPTPIRDVLLDLAADWRIKAQEARATGNDATPFPASHKLHGQADLLNQCADALEALVAENGKGAL